MAIPKPGREDTQQNPIPWHPDLRLPASGLREISVCCLRHPAHGILLQQTELTDKHSASFSALPEGWPTCGPWEPVLILQMWTAPPRDGRQHERRDLGLGVALWLQPAHHSGCPPSSDFSVEDNDSSICFSPHFHLRENSQANILMNKNKLFQAVALMKMHPNPR